MRGAQTGEITPATRTRIIPADAGSTLTDTTKRWNGGDHPRGCGEHSVLTPLRRQLPGSSPRMRGALTVMRASRPSI